MQQQQKLLQQQRNIQQQRLKSFRTAHERYMKVIEVLLWRHQRCVVGNYWAGSEAQLASWSHEQWVEERSGCHAEEDDERYGKAGFFHYFRFKSTIVQNWAAYNLV